VIDPFRSPRAVLFVPGDRTDRHAKAFRSGAEAVILDLEDAVGPEDKEVARAALSATLPRRGSGAAWIRINSPLSETGQADLEAVIALEPDAIVVPKAEPESVAIAAETKLPLVALVETAAGVLSAERTAADPAVAALMLGPVDLGLELGVVDSPDGDELLAARGKLVLVAAAAGKPGPIDGPCLAIAEVEALQAEATRARRLGFTGKACIHPGQVSTVRDTFAVGPDELRWARRVASSSEVGDGVTVLDGRMVDPPVVARAQRILQQYDSEEIG